MKKARLVCLFAVFSVLAPALADAGEAEAPFRLTVELSQKEYLECEPLVLVLKVTNVSDRPAKLPYLSNESFARRGFTYRLVKIPDGRPFTHRPWCPGARNLALAFGLRDRSLLPPGEARWCKKVIFPYELSGSRPEHSQHLSPGRYQLLLRMTYTVDQATNSPTSLVSAPVEFSVVKPEGDEAEAAARIALVPGVGSFFEGGGGEAPASLREVAGRYPETVYARHIRARELLKAMEKEWSRRLQQEADTRTLTRRVEQFLVRYPDFPLADEMTYRLTHMYRLRGRTGQEVRVLRELLAEYPDSPYRVAAEKRIVQVCAAAQQAVERGELARDQAEALELLPER